MVQRGLQRFEYESKEGPVIVVDTKALICSCYSFLDKAICKHIIAATLVDGVAFYGIKKNIETLRTLRRKRKKPEQDESRIGEDVDEDDGRATDVEDDVGQVDLNALVEPVESVVIPDQVEKKKNKQSRGTRKA
jgi:hypothetical protein